MTFSMIAGNRSYRGRGSRPSRRECGIEAGSSTAEEKDREPRVMTHDGCREGETYPFRQIEDAVLPDRAVHDVREDHP